MSIRHAVLAAIGGTAFLLKLASAFVRDMPAPKPGSVLYLWLFNSLMDAFDNPDRKGEWRK